MLSSQPYFCWSSALPLASARRGFPFWMIALPASDSFCARRRRKMFSRARKEVASLSSVIDWMFPHAFSIVVVVSRKILIMAWDRPLYRLSGRKGCWRACVALCLRACLHVLFFTDDCHVTSLILCGNVASYRKILFSIALQGLDLGQDFPLSALSCFLRYYWYISCQMALSGFMQLTIMGIAQKGTMSL